MLETKKIKIKVLAALRLGVLSCEMKNDDGNILPSHSAIDSYLSEVRDISFNFTGAVFQLKGQLRFSLSPLPETSQLSANKQSLPKQKAALLTEKQDLITQNRGEV